LWSFLISLDTGILPQISVQENWWRLTIMGTEELIAMLATESSVKEDQSKQIGFTM
jgi:hypothetical protein